jgi:hypothetical protein
MPKTPTCSIHINKDLYDAYSKFCKENGFCRTAKIMSLITECMKEKTSKEELKSWEKEFKEFMERRSKVGLKYERKKI